MVLPSRLRRSTTRCSSSPSQRFPTRSGLCPQIVSYWFCPGAIWPPRQPLEGSRFLLFSSCVSHYNTLLEWSTSSVPLGHLRLSPYISVVGYLLPCNKKRRSLLVDFSNSFNSVDCATMFHETRSRLPSISSWKYGSQPFLLLDNLSILSCCGVQQGGPLGPLGFTLVLHPVIENIKESVPGLLINAWYLSVAPSMNLQQLFP
jgi:hypothetical protein